MRGDGTPGPKTLRQLAVAAASFGMEIIGTPKQVADKMEAAMDEIGGDGFLVWRRGLTRGYIESICDGLIPELQRRGLTRTEYTKSTLRETLREF
jgi:alkanesulfonate monooxygenase SsuD/methylene tetrahydromethanopterin reductase-like flavin-dependent oxidoreductase (luciferase family)